MLEEYLYEVILAVVIVRKDVLVFDAVNRVPGVHEQLREAARPVIAELVRHPAHDPANLHAHFAVMVFLYGGKKKNKNSSKSELDIQKFENRDSTLKSLKMKSTNLVAQCPEQVPDGATLISAMLPQIGHDDFFDPSFPIAVDHFVGGTLQALEHGRVGRILVHTVGNVLKEGQYLFATPENRMGEDGASRRPLQRISGNHFFD